MPERTFGNANSYLWVRFDDEVLDQWVGAFASGDQLCSYAALSQSGGWAFVLARGPGYFIKLDSRTLLGTTDVDYLVQALYVPDADIVVACDFTDIYLYGPSGRVWCSGRVTYDGIELHEAQGASVSGAVWSIEQEEMVPFELDVTRRVFRSNYAFQD